MGESVYSIIRQLENANIHYLYKVLSGKHRGEVVLRNSNQILYTSNPQGFFRKHTDWLKISQLGISKVENTEIYCEPVCANSKVIIFGAGHVGIKVAQLARFLGNEVLIADDRPDFINEAKKLGIRTVCDSFDNILSQIECGENCYFVIVTRGHRWDQVCLKQLITKPHAYIGMMGSKRRVQIVKEQLCGEGVSRKKLEEIYSPIGMDIGAESPEELAVSIMGEIIQVKKKTVGVYTYEKTLLDALTSNEERFLGEKVLLTIVNRVGSAPREIGSKMIMLSDGMTVVGTIGGGCVEAEALLKARRILQGIEESDNLLHVNMTADEAEESGMVCGGTVDILFEKI